MREILLGTLLQLKMLPRAVIFSTYQSVSDEHCLTPLLFRHYTTKRVPENKITDSTLIEGKRRKICKILSFSGEYNRMELNILYFNINKYI